MAAKWWPKRTQPVGRVVVVPVVPNVGRRHAAVVERHDPRGDERAVVAIGDGQDAEDRKNDVEGPHRGESSRGRCSRQVQPLHKRGTMQARHFVASAVLLTLLSVPSPTLAQGGYFGRNKVQYQKFDFRVLKTEHFDIYYYPEEDKAAQMAARMAERWYTRLSKILDHELSGRQPIILYASGPHFRQTNTVEGEIGEGTGGVTEAYKRRIVLPFAGPIQSTDHVLGHELVHAFQYDITGTNVSAGQAWRPGAAAVVHRGHGGIPVAGARRSAYGHVDARSGPAREAAGRSTISNNPRYFPYRYGHALWAYIGGQIR